MTSIQIPAATIQLPEGANCKEIWSTIAQYNLTTYGQLAPQVINAALEEERDNLLHRERYVRRGTTDSQQVAARCNRCNSSDRRDFRRDGHYSRGLLSLGGMLSLTVPAVECGCGGYVSVNYQALEKWARIGSDVKERVRQRVSQGASLREVEGELAEQLQTGLGLRTLNAAVMSLKEVAGELDRAKLAECPPVVVLDGIWATWMVATGRTRKDRKGRRWQVKRGQKVVVLVALGVWPQREEWSILAWQLAPGEDEASWSAFLTQLHQAGLTQERGLKLIIADGAGGIEAARQMVYGPKVPLQRCVFHKARNVLKALRWEKGVSPKEKQEQRQRLARGVSSIWEAPTKGQALARLQAVVDQYQVDQPEAMATLGRDFADTLRFYPVQQQATVQGEHWPSRLLRTTSLLERANRELRRAIRRGCAWPSQDGLKVRVWLGTLGYHGRKGVSQHPLVYQAAEAALDQARGFSR